MDYYGDAAATPGLDPAIAAALRARQRQYPGFEGALPAPGGPVDAGLGNGRLPINSGGYVAPQHGQLLQLMQLLKQFQTPRTPQADPQARKLAGIRQALQHAQQQYTSIGHSRRANGPYSG